MNTISRRRFLVTTSALAGTMMMPALGRAAEPKESASLMDQVKSGALPPIAQRLPENPLVYTPTERPGSEGGDWNHAVVGGGGLVMMVRYQAYEPLVRFNPDWTGLTNNVAEHWEANPEATEYTFRLRKGHKWSDGAPLHHGRRQVLVRRLFHGQGHQSRRQYLVVHRGQAGPARGRRRTDLQGEVRRAQRLLRPAARMGPAGPARPVPEALSRAVPHQVQP